jgi:membrane protease YdiL (CAAX protease family)
MIDLPTYRRSWTIARLAHALLARPALAAGYRRLVGAAQTTATWCLRELAFFAVLGAVLWIVRHGERLPFASLGWRAEGLGRSLLWGLYGALFCAAGLAAALGLIHLLGLRFGGEGSGFTPPMWAMLLTVVRAAIVEEVLYRGYAIDRIARLTGSRALAVALPLAVFALAHYRQGAGGILIALILGGILTAVFLKRRDLLSVVVAHFLVDFVPNLVLPLLAA